MAWFRWGVVLVIGASGCTRDNPMFGADEGPASTGGTSPSAETQPGSADDPETGPVDSTRGTTSMGGTSSPTTTGIPPASSGPGDETGPFPVDAGMGETGGGACVPLFGPRLTLDIVPSYPFDDCVGEQNLNFQVTSLGSPTIVAGRLCPTCPCDGPEREIEFPVAPNLMSDECYGLHLQLSDEAGVGCEVLAYSISQEGTVRSVVSNVYTPVVFEPFGFVRDSDPAEPCGGGCLPESGHYGLINAAGEYVPPDSAAHVIAVDKGDVYDVYNLGSGIDTECEDVARWYAELTD